VTPPKKKKTKKKKLPYWRGWRLAALGFAALLPPAAVLFIYLLAHRGSTQFYDKITPLHDSLFGGFVLVALTLFCPLVTAACGLGLLRESGFKIVAWVLMLGGPLVLFATLVTKPA
jgi:hypothetical protein